MTDPENHVREYFYDKSGRQIVEKYTRKETHNASTPLKEATLTRYDLLGRVIEQEIARDISATPVENWQTDTSDTGNDETITATEYNAFGDVVRSGTNGIWQTENKYDLAGRMWASNAGDGIWKFFGYDKNSNQTVAITSAGYQFTSATTFQSALAQIGRTDVNAVYTVYDDRNMAVQVREEQRELKAGTTQNLDTHRTYNAFGEVVSETDARDATLSYTYNTMGRMIRSESPTVEITNEDGSSQWVKPSEDYYYDASGRLVAQRDANGSYATGGSSTNGTSKTANTGNLTRFELLAGTGYGGSEALITKQISADGGITRTGFDIHGDARKIEMLVTGSEASGIWRLTEQEFDRLGRVTKVIQPNGLELNYEYDELGNRIAEWNSLQGSGNRQTTKYDKHGRVIETRAYGGDITRTTYNWDATLEASGAGTGVVGGWVQTISTQADRASSSDSIREGVVQTSAFGRVVERKDKAGNVYDYTYDLAGRLSLESGSGSSRKELTYFNTGQAATVVLGAPQVSNTTWKNKTAEYGYDALGKLTDEMITINSGTYTPGYWVDGPPIAPGEPGEPIWIPASYSSYSYQQQDSEAEYDQLGRMTRYVDHASSGPANVDKSWTYDANGNVRSINTDYRAVQTNAVHATTTTNQTYWYRYDTMNRLVVSKGGQSGSSVTAGSDGIALTYDRLGRRATAKHGYGAVETYTYNDQDLVTSVRIGSVTRVQTSYDLLGRVLGHLERNGASQVVYERHSIQYSDRGQVLSEKSRRQANDGSGGLDWRYSHTVNHFTATGSGGSTANITGAGSTGSSTGNVLYVTKTKNWLNGSSSPIYGSSHDNNAADYELTSFYSWRDPLGSGGPREVRKDRLQQSTTTSTDTTYDDNGHITNVSYDGHLLNGNYVGDRFINYETDMAGQVTYRYQAGSGGGTAGSINERYYRFGGQAMGELGNDGTDNVDYATQIDRRSDNGDGYYRGGASSGTAYADFDINHVTMAATGAASGGSYTARGGETLQAVARQVWGDSSLWYKIAAANGLSAGSVLTAGQIVHLPSGAISNTHNASSIKPYDPASALGDTSPGTITPPNKDKNCGVFGAIFLAVIAVAITFVTAGKGAPIAAKIGAAALGSAASQAVGLATGIQDKFSFKSLAISALSAGVSQGIGELGGRVGELLNGSGLGSSIARGVVSSGITQGIATATGLQDKFSWASVAAAGVGAATGHVAAGALGPSSTQLGTFAKDVAVTTASTITIAASRSAIEGSSFARNIELALPDAIGQAIGRAIGGALAGRGAAIDAAIKGSFGPVDYGRIDLPRAPHEVAALAGGDVPLAIPTIDVTPVETRGVTVGEVAASGGGFDAVGLDLIDGGQFVTSVSSATTLEQLYDRYDRFLSGQIEADLRAARDGQVIDWSDEIAAFEANHREIEEAKLIGQLIHLGNEVTLAQVFPRPAERPAILYPGDTQISAYNPGFLGINYVRQAAYDRRVQGVQLRNEAQLNFRQADLSLAGAGRVGLGALQWTGGYLEYLSSPFTGALDATWARGPIVSPRDRESTDIILFAAGARSAVAKLGRIFGTTEWVAQTGASSRALQFWQFDEAEAVYDTIRASNSDVMQIAVNTGLPEFRVARVKNHLFFAEHRFDDGKIARFHAHPDIANSWNRMINGTHDSRDFQLFNHELFESRFEGIFRTSYEVAHKATDRSGRISGVR